MFGNVSDSAQCDWRKVHCFRASRNGTSKPSGGPLGAGAAKTVWTHAAAKANFQTGTGTTRDKTLKRRFCLAAKESDSFGIPLEASWVTPSACSNSNMCGTLLFFGPEEGMKMGREAHCCNGFATPYFSSSHFQPFRHFRKLQESWKTLGGLILGIPSFCRWVAWSLWAMLCHMSC